MPNKDDQPGEMLDPIMMAALAEDPDETEEEKKIREEMLEGATPGTPTSDDDDEEDDEDEDLDDDKTNKSDDDEDEDEDENKPDPKKPVEAEDDEEEDDEDAKKTRKEKREERYEDFLTSIRKDNAKGNGKIAVPKYNPLDYNAQPLDDEGKPRAFNADELDTDRKLVGAVEYAKGVAETKYWAEQEGFWSDLAAEGKIIALDPKLNFLSETTADGKPNPNFSPKKAGEINAQFLQAVGFKQQYKVNQQGQPLVDPKTGQPEIITTVQRNDLSYEKFARRYVKNMEEWATESADVREDETRKKVTQQRKKQGVRPNGGKRKTLGVLRPGDISNMSDEDFEKHEAEIDNQINAEMGL